MHHLTANRGLRRRNRAQRIQNFRHCSPIVGKYLMALSSRRTMPKLIAKILKNLSFDSHRRWDIDSRSSKTCSCHLNCISDLEPLINILDKVASSIINTMISTLQQTTTTSIISLPLQMLFLSTKSSASPTTNSILNVFSSSSSSVLSPVQCLSNSVGSNNRIFFH